MKKALVASLILILPILVYSQNSQIDFSDQSEPFSLNQGIYLSMEEFLANEPSISCSFEVHSSIKDYYGNPEERSEFVVSYRDNMGYVKIISAHNLWGYCDGTSVFVSYLGKPYEMVYLGAISLLRYHQPDHRNNITDLLSLYLLGKNVADPDRSQEILFHIGTGDIFYPTSRNIRKLIASDTELYADYLNTRNMDFLEKNLLYLRKYNEKYPLIISAAGIMTPQHPVEDVLVQNQPIGSHL